MGAYKKYTSLTPLLIIGVCLCVIGSTLLFCRFSFRGQVELKLLLLGKLNWKYVDIDNYPSAPDNLKHQIGYPGLLLSNGKIIALVHKEGLFEDYPETNFPSFRLRNGVFGDVDVLAWRLSETYSTVTGLTGLTAIICYYFIRVSRRDSDQ